MVLGVPGVSALVAFIYYLIEPAQAPLPERLAAGLGTLTFAGLFAAYWRGWSRLVLSQW